MVTFWLIEAMNRVSHWQSVCKIGMGAPAKLACPVQASNSQDIQDPTLKDFRKEAFTCFDNTLSFANHLGIFSEEVDMDSELIGNIPQAFSHLACVSAAMNFHK
jgi:GH15 family glucan-1,4-alpha-glucosidase